MAHLDKEYQLQDILKNLKNVMNSLKLSDNSSPDLSCEEVGVIEELEMEMKEFEEKLRRDDLESNESMSCYKSNDILSKQTLHLSSNCDEEGNQFLYEHRECLGKYNRLLKGEIIRLRKENCSYKKKLEMEKKSREGMQRDLNRLKKTLESKQMNCDKELSASVHSWDIDHLQQKQKSYDERDRDAYRGEEGLRLRNIELERILRETKSTVKSQEKKLLLYSQLVSNPTNVSITQHNVRPYKLTKAFSVPPSPSTIFERDGSTPKSLFKKYNELCRSDYDHDVSRSVERRNRSRSNSAVSISTSYTDRSFDWDFTDKDIISKGIYGVKTHKPR